jgi:hypothetical protein
VTAPTPQQQTSSEAAIENYRAEQVALMAAFLAQFVPLWSLLNWAAIDATADAWVSQATKLIREWRQLSAQLAERFYREHRLIEVPRAAPMPAIEYVHAPRDLGHVLRLPSGRNARDRSGELRGIEDRARELQRASESKSRRRGRNARGRHEPRPRIDWAEHDRAAEVSMHVTGPINLKRQAALGRDERRAKDTALVQSSGAAARQVLTGGREATMTLVEEDRFAAGWARVTDGDPCAFCAMLASRGPVYKDQQTAGFSAHDHCACTAVAVYDRESWPGLGSEFQQLWNEHIQGRYSGQDALSAWRRLIEGRRAVSPGSSRRSVSA